MRDDRMIMRMKPWQRLFAILAVTVLSFAAVPAQEKNVRAADNNPAPAGQAKAQVMILGVYHFDNPNLDYVKSNTDDHLSPKRQAEIAKVVELLAKFNPTRIALEAVDGASESCPKSRLIDSYRSRRKFLSTVNRLFGQGRGRSITGLTRKVRNRCG